MGKLLRRLVPLAAILAWRNRDQLADWYRKRGESNAHTKAPVPKTQIAPVPADNTTPDPVERPRDEATSTL